MIDTDEESSESINIWISFADVFAGLLLIVLMGLVLVMFKFRDHTIEEIAFSSNLVKSMNRATEITKQLQRKLSARLPSMSDQTKYSETQIVIPAGALFGSYGFDDYLYDPTKRQLLIDIREALRDALDQAGEERKYLRIIIEGHTDSDPIKPGSATHAIPTNWELSSRRATGVLRFFEEGNLAAKDYNIVATGLADTVPVASNVSEEDKRQNRRIVIRIEPDIDKIKASF
jgi:outer membrane protein OmpA-like peptidoglycan-associated protein